MCTMCAKAAGYVCGLQALLCSPATAKPSLRGLATHHLTIWDTSVLGAVLVVPSTLPPSRWMASVLRRESCTAQRSMHGMCSMACRQRLVPPAGLCTLATRCCSGATVQPGWLCWLCWLCEASTLLRCLVQQASRHQNPLFLTGTRLFPRRSWNPWNP